MDFSHYFRSKTKESLESDRVRIIAGLEQVIKRRDEFDLRLVTYHLGLPINYPASPVEMRNGVLELDVHQQQAFTLATARHTFLKCDYFDCDILADVLGSNVGRRIASVKNFAYVEIMAERRNALRLQLVPPSNAEIRLGGTRLQGQLYDLSMGGFSVVIEENPRLDQGTEVEVRMQVPNLVQGSQTGLSTKAVYLHSQPHGGHHICRFSFQPDALSEAAVSRYLYQRQVEIIREIKEAS